MKHGSNLSIIVPLYINSPKLISVVEVFFTTLTATYPEAEVIVVDDCSPMDHPFAVAYRNDENLGFTQTVNRGLTLATRDILVIANDDLSFTAGDLDIFTVMDTESLGITVAQDSAGTADNTFGALWGMTRKTYELLGGLDSRCKHYFSDKLYYKKALDCCVPIIKDGSRVVFHVESATYNTIDKQALFETDREAFEGVLLSDGNSL